jgi:superfamily I DNA/RNA helicase
MTDIPLDEDEFLTRLEEANREAFDDPGWSFNDAQRRAILHGDGPLQVTAGPGSGKTEVLICRALKLLLVDTVSPKSILLTTFTEKAAQNLEERIVDRLSRIGFEDTVDANELRTGTLHSLCNDIMQEYSYEDYTNVELLDEDGQQLFLYDNCAFVDVLRGAAEADDWATVNGDQIDDVWEFFESLRFPWKQGYPPNKWAATELTAELFNRLSQYRADTDELRESPEPGWRVCAEGLDRYRETLRENQRCDFARLLERFITFLDSPGGRRFVEGEPDRDKPPVEHVLIDEYQDTNPIQQELYFRLAEELEAPNITVVGDDDQALYRFRGGTVECLIQFPERVSERFGVDVETVQLRANYRSTHDIVSWCNRYVGEYPLMQREDARAPDKQSMQVARTDTEGRPSVRRLSGGDSTAADRAAELVERLHDEGYIEDYSQVAFLFKSTKESGRWAGPYVEALEDRDIPVHNPRNKAFLDRPEVQFALGALVQVLDPSLEGADAPWVNLQGGVSNQVEEWRNQFPEYVEEYDATELESFVDDRQAELDSTPGGDSLGYTLLELLYQVLSFDPFQRWIEGSDRPDRGRRLGQLTRFIDSFTSVTGHAYLEKSGETNSVSTSFLGSFYWTFCGYLQSTEFDEPEDPHDQLPAGFVQFMTTHQVKGLEFPVVFVADLDEDPWTSGTYWLEDQLEPYADITPVGAVDSRAERDEVRRFYVSYSRAEEDLVLLGPSGSSSELPLGYDADGQQLNEDWFSGERTVEEPDDFLETTEGDVGALDELDLKRRYSITGDVLAYRRCKRQYGYYNELNFTPNHVTQLFFGRVVHETLDRAHRHYAGDLEGVPEGEIPDDDDIETYFYDVAEALKARNIYPMSEEAEETALDYIQRFNRREGEWLYPRVKDTEYRLQSNRDDFVLEGVVDVLTSDDDGNEIWDYKAGQRPESGGELGDYRAQLYTYAELYRYRAGEYPDRGVIYFLGEESRDEAMFEIEFEEGAVEGSITEFKQTVENIETDRQNRNWFDITEAERPSDATCVECDLRWNCPARPEYQRQ